MAQPLTDNLVTFEHLQHLREQLYPYLKKMELLKTHRMDGKTTVIPDGYAIRRAFSAHWPHDSTISSISAQTIKVLLGNAKRPVVGPETKRSLGMALAGLLHFSGASESCLREFREKFDALCEAATLYTNPSKPREIGRASVQTRVAGTKVEAFHRSVSNTGTDRTK